MGDEAVLAGLLHSLRRLAPDLRLVVLSNDPPATTAMHGVEASSRAPAEVWGALGGARLLICGGGSLVQDVTSARSAVYYLGVMRAATWRNVPVAVVGQGIGPIRRPWVQSLATRVFADARTISVRDAGSAGLLASMGVTREIHLGADLALLAPVDSSERIQARIAAEGLDLGRVRIGMAVRAWPGMRDIGELGRGIGRFAEMVGGRIAVFPFDRAQDLEVSEAVAAAAQGRVIAAETPAELLGLIGTMDVMVAVRLHGLVFAAAQGVPAVGVAYDPKVTAFMAELGLPGVLPLDATGLALAEALARAWHGRIALRSRVRAALPRLQARATEGIERVVRLLAEPLRE